MDAWSALGRPGAGILGAAATAALALILAAPPAGAACVDTSDDASTVVFVGVAQRVDDRDAPTNDYGASTTFSVDSWLVGTPPEKEDVVVLTNLMGAGPGRLSGVADDRPVVVPGDQWEIHARPRPDGLLETACSSSTRLATGVPIRRSLDPDAVPWLVGAGIAAVALISLPLSIALVRHRRSSRVRRSVTRREPPGATA